ILGSDWAEGAYLDNPYVEMDYKRAIYGGRAHPQSLLYHRPIFTGDQALFHDLTIYAPGLNTFAADIQAVLQAEAKGTRPVQGTIDPGAKALIDKARSVGWQTITIPAPGANTPGSPNTLPARTIYANGAGQYVFERVLWSGL